MNNGRTLKIFLVDGAPTGLLTAEIMNWTGHVLTGPRSRLTELVQRPEAKRTGVYFLVGPDAGGGIGTHVYIGETDVGQRMKEHNRPEEKGGKDFWEKVCVVTSKDANLTKGHVKYLESRLIKIADAAGRCKLQNGTDPGYANLPEADRSDMEFFLEQIVTLLPVLGFDFLRSMPRTIDQGASGGLGKVVASALPVFVADLRKLGIRAKAQEIDGEFVVMKDSQARISWEGVGTSYSKLFADLQKAGVLTPSPDSQYNVFTKDYAFSSPSAAAAMVAGRQSNGRIQWVLDGTNKTYGEWQDEQVSIATAQSNGGNTATAPAELSPTG